jgi:hypothetical protein
MDLLRLDTYEALTNKLWVQNTEILTLRQVMHTFVIVVKEPRISNADLL